MPGINPQEFIYLVPEIFLGVCGMILLLAGVLGRGIGNREATMGALFSLVVTLGLVMWIQQDLSETRVILSGLFVMDSYAFFWKLVVIVATGLQQVRALHELPERLSGVEQGIDFLHRLGHTSEGRNAQLSGHVIVLGRIAKGVVVTLEHETVAHLFGRSEAESREFEAEVGRLRLEIQHFAGRIDVGSADR